MAAPKTYAQYLDRMTLSSALLYVVAKEAPMLGYATKVAKLRRIPEEKYTTEAGPCKNVKYGDFKGEVWDYDESWIVYNRSPEWKFFFDKYLFPRDYFLAVQQYVRNALVNKPATSANIRDKALWALDVLAHVNYGLLATNLHAEVLGDLSLVNDISAVINQTRLNDIITMLLDSYRDNTHSIWTYARNVWKKNGDNPLVRPLMCAEFSDLLLLPAATSSSLLNDLHGMSRLVRATCELQFAPGQRTSISVPYGSWQDSGEDVVQMMPWVNGGLVEPLEAIHKDLFNNPAIAGIGANVHKAFGLKSAYESWMLLNVYRTQKWFIDREWRRADSSKIPEVRRFISLTTFLEKLSPTPGLRGVLLGSGSGKTTAIMPNFAYIYNNGGIDAWAKYFISLKYKEYIEAGAHMWGQALAKTPSTSVWEMQTAINENLTKPRDIVSSTADAVINLSVDTAAGVLKSLSAAAIAGTVAGFSIPTLGAGAIVGGIISLFTSIVGATAIQRKIRAEIRKYKLRILDGYRVIPQIFMRVVPKQFADRRLYSYSTDVGSWTRAASLGASASALQVARAFESLLRLLPEDTTPATWQQKIKPPEVPDRVPAPTAPPVDLAEIARATSKTYKSTHPNLFKHPDVGELWVTDQAAMKLKQAPGWTFVRRRMPTLLAPAPDLSTKRRKTAVVLGIAAAAAAWAIGLV